jgi:hypothetical protein
MTPTNIHTLFTQITELERIANILAIITTLLPGCLSLARSSTALPRHHLLALKYPNCDLKSRQNIHVGVTPRG